MDQNPQFPTAFFGAMGVVMSIYFVVMIGVTITVIIALWRAMRAHEKIADHLADVANAIRSTPKA